MSFFIMYLLMIIGNIQEWLKVIAIIVSIATGASIFIRFFVEVEVESELQGKVVNGYCKAGIFVAVFFSLIIALIPTKQDMAIIAAGGLTYNAVTSDTAKEIGDKSVRLLNKKIEEMLDDPVTTVTDAKKIVDAVSDKK